MAKTNKSQNSGSSSGDALGIIAIAGAVIGLAKPVIEIIDDKRKERVEEQKDWVTIPELCSKRSPMKLDCAIDILEKLNLKVASNSVKLNNADIKYKDCFDLQIVRVETKHKKKVPPGTLVVLTYVTSEIIEESKKLFEESETHKAKVSLEKSKKRSEQKEKHKQLITNTIEKISKKNNN